MTQVDLETAKSAADAAALSRASATRLNGGGSRGSTHRFALGKAAKRARTESGDRLAEALSAADA